MHILFFVYLVLHIFCSMHIYHHIYIYQIFDIYGNISYLQITLGRLKQFTTRDITIENLRHNFVPLVCELDTLNYVHQHIVLDTEVQVI